MLSRRLRKLLKKKINALFKIVGKITQNRAKTNCKNLPNLQNIDLSATIRAANMRHIHVDQLMRAQAYVKHASLNDRCQNMTFKAPHFFFEKTDI